MDLSIVVPMYNEAQNVRPLCEEISEALSDSGLAYEVVCVDDGSTDGTADQLSAACRDFPRLRAVRHTRRCGQTAALATGFTLARGHAVATLDGDRQNDPRDLPRLHGLLDRFDMVNGYRERRRDSWLRRLSSRIANRFRSTILDDGITDVGCSTRVFKRTCLQRIKLYDGMHRFLPALFLQEGFTIGQFPVNHRQRAHGRSKYGIGNRLFRGLRDLLAVRWMQDRRLAADYREIEPR